VRVGLHFRGFCVLLAAFIASWGAVMQIVVEQAAHLMAARKQRREQGQNTLQMPSRDLLPPARPQLLVPTASQ
jgi:hypothetical protein